MLYWHAIGEHVVKENIALSHTLTAPPFLSISPETEPPILPHHLILILFKLLQHCILQQGNQETKMMQQITQKNVCVCRHASL